MRALVVLCLAGVIASGCQCGGSSSALSITVGFEDSVSRCVVAGVQLEGTTVFHATARAARRGDKTTLVYAVARTESIKGRVIPFARGYAATDCATVDLARFDEAVFGPGVDLDAPGVTQVSLTLRGERVADGGCGVVDCALPACETRACSGDAGTCQVTRDGGRGCIQPGPELLCTDLLDNDDDGRSDCADDDCDGQTCDDQSACTTVERCGGRVCSPSAVTSCPNTTLPCRATSGQCAPATGLCVYEPYDAGALCDDNALCSHNDVCDGLGVCSGTAYACDATTCATNRQCNGLGGCNSSFPDASTPCDDATSCTHTDRCSGTGLCVGVGYTCTLPVCFSGSGCAGDGGCSFVFNGAGSACPGGTCAADAGCVRVRDFAYAASNFFPNDIPDASIAPATTFSACTVEFDTTTNTTADGGWCNQVMPVPFVYTQDGGISTTVLPMAGFELQADSTLIISGSRPLIVAVFGNTSIHGVIDARSFNGGGRIGPGGNWSGCGLMNGGNALGSAGGGGAGFGTAGARGGGTGLGDGGLAGTNPTLSPLTGGCVGGRGHDSSNRYEAPGGPGGGAVQITTSGVLTVSGTISSSGAGGLGGAQLDHNGGGGGGSGGAILLEGLQLWLSSSAKLTCNGGAGGGGREDSAGLGVPGQDGALATALSAVGGQGGSPGAGDGGSGAAGLTPPAPGVFGASVFGSGGGGAGLGVIRLNGVSSCSIDAGVLLSGVVSRSTLCP